MSSGRHATVEDRYGRERRFHDTLIEEGHERPAGRFYAVNESSWAFFRRILLDAAEEARAAGSCAILSYGDGAGAYSSLALAEAGYPSIAIDISPASVRAARARVEREHPDADVDFRVMNAEALEFEDDSFDLICGNGILHHLDLERSYTEIVRTLRPGGSAIFSEPLGHNPLINLYRRLTPGQRTPDEHPLRVADLDLARRYFDGVETWYFHLSAIAATPFRNTRLFRPLLRALDALDRRLFAHVRPLRKHAWLAVIRLTSPRKSGAAVAGPHADALAADKTIT